ncbi:basic proline-rich protein-like [Panthera tigris]|uniref:basic proline-rich protein-like n=1 Tax=Panthera tigris TaxID=9694 RepID=UPI001C6FB950|nr:basic proline-rich protein-like [Panthera tigris]
MAGRRREHTKEAASAGNKKLAGASPERPLPPCPPPRVTLGASAPHPSLGFSSCATTKRWDRSPPGRRRPSARRSYVRRLRRAGLTQPRGQLGGLAGSGEARPGVRPEGGWLRSGGPPRRGLCRPRSRPNPTPARLWPAPPLSVKPGLPGAGLARQQPTPTQSGEEAPPETTEEQPSSKTPPPQQRSTSAPEASAPPPVRSHWPPLLVLPWSTGAGGRRWTVEGLHTDQHRCMPGPGRCCRSEPGVKSRWWIP